MPSVTIFCEDKEAATGYQTIVDYIIRETGFDSFELMRIYADMELPVFSCYLKFGASGRAIKLEDVADIIHDGITEINVKDEQYIPMLLDYVWKKFGRGAVEQPERLRVVVHGNAEGIAELIVSDTASKFKNRAINFLNKIIPEGFKVRKMLLFGDSLLLVTSEETIKDEWVKKSKEVLL